MRSILYWGEHLNWTPVIWLGVAGVLLLAVRLLTVWLYFRRIQEVVGDSPDEHDDATLAQAQELFSSQKPIVPAAVSGLYFLFGLAFIAVTFWGLVSTAWWMILLGVVVWLSVHWPFRAAMLSLAQLQKACMVTQDADALLKGHLSPEQAATIKKRLGI